MIEPAGSPARFRYTWPLLLVCGALLVCMLVLVVLNLPTRAGDLPDLTLRDPAGRAFDLSGLDGRIWVAGFVSSRCVEDCPATFARLAELHDGLAPGVRQVSFVVDAEGLWPPAPPLRREGWVVCQGNTVDADDEDAVRDLATAHLDFSEEDLARLRDGSARALLVAVDRRGRPRGGQVIVDPSSDGAARAVARIAGEVDFLATLNRRPMRHAVLNALSAVLLGGAVLFIRRRWVMPHVVCVVLATATTLVFLASYLNYHYHVGSMPFRGQGWSRPLYFGVLLTHTALAGFVVPLVAAQYYHAARGDFARHRKFARWTVPIWVYVSVTGVLIYFMLYIWFPGI